MLDPIQQANVLVRLTARFLKHTLGHQRARPMQKCIDSGPQRARPRLKYIDSAPQTAISIQK